MPTWLWVLLCLPLALWFVYCVLRSALGASLCAHCVFSWSLLPSSLGLWLIYSGFTENVEKRVVFGATIVIVACICGGVGALILRLSAKRQRERLARQRGKQAMEDATAMAGAAAMAASVVGQTKSDGEPGPGSGADIDAGLDV